MKIGKLAVIYLFFLLLNLLIVSIAPSFLPFKGFFPYKEVLDEYSLPRILSLWGNFDGAHYIIIARQGYQQFQQALFPLYPLLMWITSFIFLSNELVAGLFISGISFFASLIYLSLFLKKIGKKENEIFWTVILLLAYPSSYYFQALYTESLFFLFFCASLYYFYDKKYILSATTAVYTSLTRLMGVFLTVIYANQWYYDAVISHLKKDDIEKKHWRSILQTLWKHTLQAIHMKKINWRYLLVMISPVVGIIVYMVYLHTSFGDPLMFLNSQSAFDANRSTDKIIILPQVLYRYIKIFLTADTNYQFYQALFEFSLYILASVAILFEAIKRLRQWYLTETGPYMGLLFFSIINMILPTLTGTLSSTTRYSLMSLSIFIFLGEIKNVYIRYVILALSIILHIIMLSLFSQGYFIG